MIASLIAASVITGAQQQPTVAPAGVSEAFLRAVQQTRSLLASGQFEKAAALADTLPKLEVKIRYDDSAVPDASRSIYRDALNDAMKGWHDTGAFVKASIGEPADVVISFSGELAPMPDGRPRGAAHFSSYAAGQPDAEAVIGLKRGIPLTTAEKLDVMNEISFAIGTALGLAPQPLPNGAMGRVEDVRRLPGRPNSNEARTARENIALSDMLRAAAKDRKRLEDATPRAVIDSRKLEGGEAMQGDEMIVSFSITNRGKAPLRYRLVPDCSCFQLVRQAGEVLPGETEHVRIGINTMDFTGDLNKSMFVYTNDPDLTSTRLPFTAQVEPAYEFVQLWGDQTMQLQVGQAAEGQLILLRHPEVDFKAESISIAGAKASALFRPWSGTLPDGRSGSGYAVRVSVEPYEAIGRYNLVVEMQTDSKKFSRIRHGFTAQNGILASPATVYFGDIPQGTARAHTYLSKGGKNFKVTMLESDNPNLRAVLEPAPEATMVKVVVLYNGKGDYGTTRATIKAHTNDPTQPIVLIPVMLIVQ